VKILNETAMAYSMRNLRIRLVRPKKKPSWWPAARPKFALSTSWIQLHTVSARQIEDLLQINLQHCHQTNRLPAENKSRAQTETKAAQ